MAENKNIDELQRSGDGSGNVHIRNKQGIDLKIEPQALIGGKQASFSWDVEGAYDFEELVLDNNKVWSSLIAGIGTNIGNKPNENSFWTEVAISEADGITLTPHSIGVFTYNDSAVQIGGAIYFLNVSAPYESTDFAAELIAGDWIVSPLPPQNYYDFITQVAAPAYQAGREWFDGTNFNLYDNIVGTSIQIGKELVVDGYNNNGITLTNFTACNYDIAVGGFPGMKRALADTVDNAENPMICTHDILVGEVGKFTSHGTAVGDTSAWNTDDLLFVSATTPGLLTNIEQEILSPCARVLVSDADPDVGKIFCFQRGIVNVTAIGQAAGLNETQAITAVPEKIYCFDADKYEINVDVTQVQNPEVGEDGYSAIFSPASPGASGFYRLSVSLTLTGSANAQHIVEIYLNGSPTGFIGIVDLQNNNIDAGSASIVGTFTQKITDSDEIELYTYTDGGSSTVIWESALGEIERTGNI